MGIFELAQEFVDNTDCDGNCVDCPLMDESSEECVLDIIKRCLRN